jgi:FMN phosphatase YigB (HAD superfamily)
MLKNKRINLVASKSKYNSSTLSPSIRKQLLQIFDHEYYCGVSGHRKTQTDAFNHFIENDLERNISPSPLFDVSWYAKQVGLPNDDSIYIIDYLERGYSTGLSPHPLFDVEWYTEKSRGKINPEENALLHYMRHARDNNSDPHPLFNTWWYLTQNHDVASSDVNPLCHFIKHGAREGRCPSPLFNLPSYRRAYPESAGEHSSPILEFIERGMLAIGDACPDFDVIWYINHYPDVAIAKVHPLLHYLKFGASEGRDPSAQFSTSWYIAQNPDVAAAGLDPFTHYVAAGKLEGRRPHPHAVSLKLNDFAKERRFINGAPLRSLSSYASIITTGDREPSRQPFYLAAPETAAKLLSFDIWSTILHRECHPDEIKLQSARFMLLKNRRRLKPAYVDLLALFDARIRNENAAAPNGDHEYRFSDAILGWIDEVSEAGMPAAERAALHDSLLQHEMDAELRSTWVDPRTTDLARNAAIPSIYLSDFYMDGKFISNLLMKHGIRNLFCKGYVSSDSYETKRGGKLFYRLLSDFQLEPSQVLHVGDNKLADQQVPLSLGFNVLPYNITDEEDRLNWYGEAFWRTRELDFNLHEKRILSLMEDAALSLPSESGKDLRAAGLRMAPLAFSYCLSILEAATAFGDDKVYFFTREGHFLRSLYETIRGENPLNMDTPAAEILEVSRKATFAASLKELSASELKRMWSLYSKQSPYALCVSLNLDLGLGAAAAKRTGLDFDQPVASPDRDPRFLAFLADAKFKSYAEKAIAKQRAGLLDYLAQKDIKPGVEQGLCVVDIGWRGTIQDNLSHLLERPIRGHYLALFGYLNQQPKLSSKLGWLGDGNIPGAPQLRDQVAPLEMIFNGPGGSVVGYEKNDDGVTRALTMLVAGEEAIVEELAPFREGMLEGARILAKYVRLHGLMAEHLLPLSRKIAEAFINTPPVALADTFSRLEHNESFGVGATENVNVGEGDPFASSNTGAALHAELSHFLSTTRWQEAASREPRVANWWRTATDTQKASVPIAISRVHSPALVNSVGSRLAVYAPAPIRASGGHRTIFNMVRRLSDIGVEPHIYLENPGAGVEVIEEYLQGTRATIDLSWRTERKADIALATIAHSAQHIAEKVDASLKAYLVQDFEALFNPVGDAYVVCENSFAQQLHHVTVGNWLTHVIRHQYAGSAAGSGLGVDTAVYRKLPEVMKRRAVCMLVQPDKPRRGNDLGLAALRILKKNRPDVDIFLFGTDQHLHLDFETTQLGLISDLHELNALYNQCTAGVCISLSNPSRIPFEMMAAGCVPVDVYRYNNLMDYHSNTAVLAYQSPHSIAEAIISVIDRESSAMLAEDLAIYGANRTLDWEMDGCVNNLAQLLEGRSALSGDVSKTYTIAPIIAKVDRTDGAIAFCAWQAKQAMLQHDAPKHAHKKN